MLGLGHIDITAEQWFHGFDKDSAHKPTSVFKQGLSDPSSVNM